MRSLKDLTIPVNPSHKLSADPSLQSEYVNPVTLNNMELAWANAAIEVTDRITRKMKELAEAKNKRDQAREEIDDFEGDILRLHPVAGGTKTLKLIDAHILLIADQQGKLDEYRALLRRAREAERQIVLCDAAIEAGKQAYQMIKLLGEHGQTHLSFVKQEYKQARGY